MVECVGYWLDGCCVLWECCYGFWVVIVYVVCFFNLDCVRIC